MDQIFCQWAAGNAQKARISSLASAMRGSIFAKLATSWSLTRSQASTTASGSGCAKMVLNTAAAMCWWLRGTRASRLRMKMHPAPLSGGALQGPVHCRGEPSVGVRDD